MHKLSPGTLVALLIFMMFSAGFQFNHMLEASDLGWGLLVLINIVIAIPVLRELMVRMRP